MKNLRNILLRVINAYLIIATTNMMMITNGALDEFSKMMGRCSLKSSDFDSCMKGVFNDLRVFFKTGIPEFNIRPFDPHRASYVEQRRGNIQGFGGYKLILRNVSEHGWSASEVTKFKLDRENKQIIYTQNFPEKHLDGFYEFTAMIMGTSIKRHGQWNLSLFRYEQTTTIKRLGPPGSPLKFSVIINKIGDMKLNIENFFGSERRALNSLADTVINSMWELGLPALKPLIEDLVNSAFTAIINASFRYFPLERFFS